jgi:sec-independent protein translocase protein TatA
MGISTWHLLILLAIVLVIFGPSRLGGLGKSMGEAIRGFKKGLNEDPEIDVTNNARREQLQDQGTGTGAGVKTEKKDRV